jgi:hypothetical protein
MRGTRTGIAEVDAALRQSEAATRARLDRCPFLEGEQLDDIRLEAGVARAIPHPLKRRYRGFLVVGRDAAATVHNTRTSTDDRKVTLTASDDVLVSIWIY